MSNLYIPEDETLQSSPALPHLQTCIEAVVREAVQSGRPEGSVRGFLELHTDKFEGMLATLHGVYGLHPAQESAEASAAIEPSNRPRPNLLPAAEIVERQPSKHNDGFKTDKVEDGLDDNDEDDLAVDEDAKKAGNLQEEHPHVRRPRATLSYGEKKPAIAASDRLNQVLGLAFRSPGFPTSQAGFEAGATVDRSPGSDDGSETPRQKTFADRSPSPGRQTFLYRDSAFATGVDRLSLDAIDLEQAKSDQGKEKVRAWDDGRSLSEGAMVDPNSLEARHQSFNTSEEAGLLLDSLAETKRLSSPDADKLALHARDPVQLEKSIRAKKAGEQTEKKEMLDPKSAATDTISPGNVDETGGDHQRSSAHHADLGSGDDKSPNKTKSSPVTEAARAQLERDTDTKAEDWQAKLKGKERGKEKEARRSPVRRS
jgi:hypothetical protein